MSTGVVINGYEIINWHTVSLLELWRNRKERGRTVAQPETQGRKVMDTPISDDHVLEAHNRYMTGGEKNGDIADDYNMTWAGLVYRFNRLGLTYPRQGLARGSKISDSMIQEIHQRYMAGESLNEMCSGTGRGHYDISPRTAATRFEKLGLVYPRPAAAVVEASDPISISAALDDTIRELHRRYTAGEALAQLLTLKEFQLPGGSATDYFRDLGLPFPRSVIALHPGHKVAIEVMRDNGFDEGEIAQAVAVDHQLKLTESADLSTKVDAEEPEPPAMDDPEPYAAAADSPVIAAQEMVTFPRLVTAFDDVPLQPDFTPTRRPYAPPAIIREGSLRPVAVPEIQAMPVNTLEQLPRLADLLRDLRGIEGIRIAGSVSIALSIEADL